MCFIPNLTKMFSCCIIDDVLNFLKSKKRKRVLLTGFGSFDEFEGQNPSWKAVENVHSKLKKKNQKIMVHKEKIPVEYKAVDLIVPRLLDRERPDLTIHVGVSSDVKCLVLEKRAKKKGYKLTDAAYHVAALHQNPSPGPDIISTVLNVDAIRDEFNSLETDLRAEVSDDAGSYLCEYIYYTSLSLNRCPTLFVHVPPETYTTEQLVRGLERIIELCVKQLDTETDMYPVEI